ncbi:disulfide bond formation protein B [Ostreiculturibacter nitratireducens]|uniref:disulfide bond formation protein B n=1 Tax=Ostreiculturibacter nitratireducens TaxID=3075226 RepID=UPI0031B5DF9C
MTRTRLILLAAGGSAALLAGAFFFQALGYAPCKLCLWQRWPHGAAILIGALALIIRLPLLAWLGALAAAATGGLGIYHTGVERGFWPGPDTCTSGGDIGNLTAAQLLEQINQAPLIRCDEVAWEFLSLSMASWNAILSFALAAIWIMAARKTR